MEAAARHALLAVIPAQAGIQAVGLIALNINQID